MHVWLIGLLICSQGENGVMSPLDIARQGLQAEELDRSLMVRTKAGPTL
jgi:hypothetical protein